MNLSKVFNTMLALMIGLIFTFCVFGAYFLCVEQPWLSYTQLPFRVISRQVKTGEAVMMSVLRCNSDTKTRVYMVSHILMPEDRAHLHPIMLPATATSIAPGCSEILSTVNVVPPGAAPGRYHVEGFAEINGTIKTFSIGWSSETFNVVQ
jgi:hypothetical protein